jgi:hypothetical protein
VRRIAFTITNNLSDEKDRSGPRKISFYSSVSSAAAPVLLGLPPRRYPEEQRGEGSWEGRTEIPSILLLLPLSRPARRLLPPPSRWDTRLDSVSAHDPAALTTVARLRSSSFLRPRASRVLPSRWSGLPGEPTSLRLISSSLSLALFFLSFFLSCFCV